MSKSLYPESLQKKMLQKYITTFLPFEVAHDNLLEEKGRHWSILPRSRLRPCTQNHYRLLQWIKWHKNRIRQKIIAHGFEKGHISACKSSAINFTDVNNRSLQSSLSVVLRRLGTMEAHSKKKGAVRVPRSRHGFIFLWLALYKIIGP